MLRMPRSYVTQASLSAFFARAHLERRRGRQELIDRIRRLERPATLD